jgi:hypothetical protein
MKKFPVRAGPAGTPAGLAEADGAGVRLPLKVAVTLAPGATDAPGTVGIAGVAPGIVAPGGGFTAPVVVPGGGGFTAVPGAGFVAGAPGAGLASAGLAGAAAFAGAGFAGVIAVVGGGGGG